MKSFAVGAIFDGATSLTVSVKVLLVVAFEGSVAVTVIEYGVSAQTAGRLPLITHVSLQYHL